MKREGRDSSRTEANRKTLDKRPLKPILKANELNRLFTSDIYACIYWKNDVIIKAQK